MCNVFVSSYMNSERILCYTVHICCNNIHGSQLCDWFIHMKSISQTSWFCSSIMLDSSNLQRVVATWPKLMNFSLHKSEKNKIWLALLLNTKSQLGISLRLIWLLRFHKTQLNGTHFGHLTLFLDSVQPKLWPWYRCL